MTLAERWLKRPHSVWLRKALFQIHLWTGIGVGLYVLAISISGSVIVFRNEIYKALGDGPRIVAVSGERLSQQAMRDAAHRAYPGYAITFLWEARRPNQATEIWLEKNSRKKQRLFDPYTGRDIGNSVPYGIRFVSWMSDLHTDLLAGPKGRIVNGIGSILLTALCITGAVLWWPGVQSWRRSLFFNSKANWKRLNWELHSVLGFWTFAIVFMWAITGIYLAFPGPFQVWLNRITPLEQYKPVTELETPLPPAQVRFVQVADPPAQAVQEEAPRPRRPRIQIRRTKGDIFLRWIYYLHFGNFAGSKTKAVWLVLGLAPVFLFITGTIMWWNRVVSREARRLRRRADTNDLSAAAVAGEALES